MFVYAARERERENTKSRDARRYLPSFFVFEVRRHRQFGRPLMGSLCLRVEEVADVLMSNVNESAHFVVQKGVGQQIVVDGLFCFIRYTRKHSFKG